MGHRIAPGTQSLVKIEGTIKYPINDALRVEISGGTLRVTSKNSEQSVPIKQIFSLRDNLFFTVNSKIGKLFVDGKQIDGVKAVKVNSKSAMIVKQDGQVVGMPFTPGHECVITAD